MQSLKFLAVAIGAVFLVSACAKKEEATSASADSASDNGIQASSVAPEAGSQEALVVAVGDRVFFDFNSSSIRGDQEQTLDRLIVWLNRNDDVRALIGGHADERGTTEYNLALGERRANAAREYLIAGGIAGARLQTVSFGEERPAGVGSNENVWTQNRRAQFTVR